MIRLNSAVRGVVAALALSQAAQAADVAVRGPAEPYHAPYNWAGPYFGVSIGLGTGRSTQSTTFGDLTPRFDVTGGLFGLALGYNWQAGVLLYGIDTDISVSTVRGTTAYLGAFPGFLAETSQSWLATYRGRLGLVASSWMFYVTAGGATTSLKITATEPPFGIAWESQVRTGWVAGVGVEAGRIHSFTVKAEYLYADFGNSDYFNPPPAGFFNRAGGVRFTEHIFRIGLNHKFAGF